jgi:hypothetical protein
MALASELRAIARAIMLHQEDPVQTDRAVIALYGVAADVETMERTATVAAPQRLVGPLPPNVVDLRDPSYWRAAS